MILATIIATGNNSTATITNSVPSLRMPRPKKGIVLRNFIEFNIAERSGTALNEEYKKCVDEIKENTLVQANKKTKICVQHMENNRTNFVLFQ